MKTLTKEIIQFDTLEEILNATDHQINAQELLNERMYLNGMGWTDVELSPELKERIVFEIADLLGGRYSTRQDVIRSLKRNHPQHWGLERILVEKYGDSAPVLSYCAGQDYTWETNKIRTYLKNL